MPSQPADIDADVRSLMGRDSKRTANKTVLDARQRLTSSSGTRASYDFELMHDYAGSRLASAQVWSSSGASMPSRRMRWSPK